MAVLDRATHANPDTFLVSGLAPRLRRHVLLRLCGRGTRPRFSPLGRMHESRQHDPRRGLSGTSRTRSSRRASRLRFTSRVGYRGVRSVTRSMHRQPARSSVSRARTDLSGSSAAPFLLPTPRASSPEGISSRGDRRFATPNTYAFLESSSRWRTRRASMIGRWRASFVRSARIAAGSH